MGGMGEGREVQEGGDIGVHIADSLHCTAETNIVKQLYSNQSINKIKSISFEKVFCFVCLF